MKKKIMVFSTRYLNEDELSIFFKTESKNSEALALARARIEFASISSFKEKLERLQREGIPIKAEQIKVFLSSLFRIDIDNVAMWNSVSDALCKNQNDEELSKRKGDGYTPTIWKYLKYHQLSDSCILELSSIVLPESAGVYYEREEKEKECVIKAIGVPYLYENHRQYAKQWARALIDCFKDDDGIGDISMLLGLHGSTDWSEDDFSGYKDLFSKEIAKDFSSFEKVLVYTFHHEPDSDPIAKAIHSNQKSLNSIWDDIFNKA